MYVHSNKSDIFLEKLQMLICIENLWIENAPPHHWKFLQKNIKFVFKKHINLLHDCLQR